MVKVQQHQVIADTADILLEIIDGRAFCRECLIDPEGSSPELDFRAFSSGEPGEFSAHLLKHLSLRHEIPADRVSLSYWKVALDATQRR